MKTSFFTRKDSIVTNKNNAIRKTSKKSIRHLIQILFFIVILLTVIAKSFEGKFSIPLIESVSLHTICPFGGVVSFYDYITTGRLLQKIHASSIILLYAVLAISLLFGPAFCSFICPFGTFQEFISIIGRKIFGKRYNHLIPEKIDKLLGLLRYIILILVLYNTIASASLVFQDVDPYYALFHLFSSETAIASYVALVITILLSLAVERPFCKYMCPFGASLSFFNLIKIFRIHRNTSTCVGCDKCSNNCPMNIPVSQKTNVRDLRCISCMQCTSDNNCPIAQTVEMKIGGNRS